MQPMHTANATIVVFLPNKNVRAIDLLYGLILPSGAEYALGLAKFVEGFENAFVSLMNKKAFEIGMNNTNFINATRLYHENQFSTAYDMAILLKYALQNDTFYLVITSAPATSPP